MSKALKEFCNKKGIDIKYLTLYMYEKNGITEQYQKTFSTVKDFLLIENYLLINFQAEEIDIANYL